MTLIQKLEEMRKFALKHYSLPVSCGALAVIDELIRWENKQAGINTNVVRPAVEGERGGELLQGEGSEKGVSVELCSCGVNFISEVAKNKCESCGLPLRA